jgi:hypothetical protein
MRKINSTQRIKKYGRIAALLSTFVGAARQIVWVIEKVGDLF